MRDLQNTKLMWLKGILLLCIGIVCAVLLILQSASWFTVTLLAIAVWAFCRAYYFAFYVIEHYIDPAYKFSGLGSFIGYVLNRKLENSIQPAHVDDSKSSTEVQRPQARKCRMNSRLKDRVVDLALFIAFGSVIGICAYAIFKIMVKWRTPGLG